MNRKPGNGSAHATLKTGLFWQPHWLSDVRSGPKTPTSFGCGVAIWTSNNIDMFLAE